MLIKIVDMAEGAGHACILSLMMSFLGGHDHSWENGTLPSLQKQKETSIQ